MKRQFLILFFVAISNVASVLPTDIFAVFSDSEKLQGFNESNGLQSAFMLAIENEAHGLQSKGEALATAIAAKKVSDQAAIAKMAADKEAADANARVELTADSAKAARAKFDQAISVVDSTCSVSVSADKKLLEAKTAYSDAKALAVEKNNDFRLAVQMKRKEEYFLDEALKNADEAEAAAKLAVANRITANINYADAAIATERAFAAVRLFDGSGDAEVMV